MFRKLSQLLICASMLVACGTTVPLSASSNVPGGGGIGGEQGSTSSLTLGSRGGATTGVSASAGSQSGGAAGGAVGTRATPAEGGVAIPAVASAGAGGAIPIGIGVDGDAAQFAAAFGGTSSGPTEQTMAEAIVADINAHGGLAGHRLQPVYATFSDTASSWSVEDQKMCATFTQDHHVLAVVRSDVSFGLDTCLAKKRVPLVFSDALPKAESYYSAYPGLRFSPDMPSAERLYPSAFTHLNDVGWWDKSSRLGVVYYDRPDVDAVVRDVIKPALKADGLNLVDEAAVHSPNSVSDVGPTESDMEAAMFRFRSKGITHVIFTGQEVEYLWLAGAKSQGYTAKYTLFSSDTPAALKPADLVGARGIGWAPVYDGIAGATPGGPRCQRIARQVQAASADSLGSLQMLCDGLYFLQDAYNAARGVGGDALTRGAKAFRSAMTFGTTFGPMGGSGPSIARDVYQDPACTCLRYGANVTM